MNKEEPKKKNKQILTFFLVMFPSLLLSGDYGSLAVNLVLKAALLFYQFVILKAFLDDYYRILE